MLTAAASIAVGVGVVVLITALTGYFVAQEFAYTAVDRSALRAHAHAGDAAADRALAVTRRTSFLLSGAQLGITVTGLLVGYIAEPLIGGGVATLLGGVSVPSGIGVAVGAAVALTFCTLMQMLFGELFPKNLAIARAEKVARRLAASTTVYLRLFGWLIGLLDRLSNALLRAVRIEPIHDVDHAATPRDLEHIVAASRDAGELSGELSTLLDRILDFPTRTAKHAIIPRTRVDTVAAALPVTSVIESMAGGHSRYPVLADSGDEIVGVIQLLDLLDDSTGTAGTRCRPALRVPSSLPLPDLTRTLASANEEMAVVIDEYGGFAGIVTVEDVSEELVGEIADEHDVTADVDAVRHADGWLMPGDLHVDEVERLLGERLPEGDYETLAGVVLSKLGRLPDVGDIVEIALQPDLRSSPKMLTLKVEAIGHKVPASLFAVVHDAGTADE